MSKISLILSFIFPLVAIAQSFAPEPGVFGTTAIPKDSSCFVSWATGISVSRGFIDINDTMAIFDGTNRASFGTPEMALGIAEGDGSTVVSLGDSGMATLTFSQLIIDGNGFDFAIFENGFADHYMEFGHVEASSDGVNFFRFPSTSEIPLDTQLSNASYSDCRYVNNLAGKYRKGFGTPFDISELTNDPLLDKNAITHIRIIDVIGAISGSHTTQDQLGTIINDPYPTAFHSGGFDLDAVGIINGVLDINTDQLSEIQLFPNPTQDKINIQTYQESIVVIQTITGEIVAQFEQNGESVFSFAENGLAKGVYFVSVAHSKEKITNRVVVN